MRLNSALLVISLILAISINLYGQPAPGIKIVNRGFIIDKEHKEGPANLAEKVDSGYAYKYDPASSTGKTWVYANAWIGDVEAWVAGTYYLDFEITGLPPGTSFVAPRVMVSYRVTGLVDSFGLGHSDTNYRLNLTAGLTDELDFKWSRSLIRKTILTKRDKETWKSADFAITLGTAAATSLISEIPVAGDVLDVIIEAASTAWDAVNCEAKINEKGWLRFINLPLTAGKTYRVYLTLESQVKAVALVAGQRAIKVDFLGREPFFAPGSRDLRGWGLGLDRVEVIFPASVYKAIAPPPKPGPASSTRRDLFFSQKPVLLQAEKLTAESYRAVEGSPVKLQLALSSKYQDEEKIKVQVSIPEAGWKENLFFDRIKRDSPTTATIELPRLIVPPGRDSQSFTIETILDPVSELRNENRTNNRETLYLLIIPRYYQLQARNLSVTPVQTEYQQGQQLTLSGIIRNKSNVDLEAVEAAFYYNAGTHARPNLVLIARQVLTLKQGEEKTVTCTWKAARSAEYWTELYFVPDPENAIKEIIEDGDIHRASKAIVIK